MKLGGKFAHRRSDENWDAFIKNLESKKWMAEAQATGVEELHHDPDLQCEHCGSDRLELVSQTPKPTWKELFWRESETCPSLYAERQLESHRQFWTVEYGSDFYDWYLETQVESAKLRLLCDGVQLLSASSAGSDVRPPMTARALPPSIVH